MKSSLEQTKGFVLTWMAISGEADGVLDGDAEGETLWLKLCFVAGEAVRGLDRDAEVDTRGLWLELSFVDGNDEGVLDGLGNGHD